MLMTHLPPRAGVGLKADHAAAILETSPDGLWLEVHPENYMVAGGPRLRMLEAMAERFPLSFHGVGASIGGADPLDDDHLEALKILIDRFNPVSVSEHATWSTNDGRYAPDLLPLPRTRAALKHLCERVDAFQSAIGRPILLENPSVYLRLQSELDEPDFLAEVARHTGCGLLLDINNVFVSAANTGGDANAYIDRVDPRLIGEIHLAGHGEDDAVPGLLIDTHGAPIADGVWALYHRAISRFGPKPVLIERDNDIPPWAVLSAERDHADAALLRQMAVAS